MENIIDTKKEEKRLYIDAMFFHLINKGYSYYKAEFLIKRIIINREDLFL